MNGYRIAIQSGSTNKLTKDYTEFLKIITCVITRIKAIGGYRYTRMCLYLKKISVRNN